jgi:hypothetical protein
MRRGGPRRVLWCARHRPESVHRDGFPNCFDQKISFLIPIHLGTCQPALLVQQAQTFDEVSGGRLLFNQVNGIGSTRIQ